MDLLALFCVWEFRPGLRGLTATCLSGLWIDSWTESALVFGLHVIVVCRARLHLGWVANAIVDGPWGLRIALSCPTCLHRYYCPSVVFGVC